MGLFDEKSATPSGRDGRRMGSGKDTLFDWLVKKAEADLGLAQAFAAGEGQRADQIKHLETTLVGQIAELQHQILESREAELDDLKSEISVCADRMARLEAVKAPSDATKEFVQDALGVLRTQLSGRQTELETRYSGAETLGESFAAQIRALDERIREELGAVRAAQGELRHFKSEAKSLTARVGQAESTAWKNRTIASRNAQQLAQTAETLKGEIVALKALCAEINDQQRNFGRPDSVREEIAQSVGAKIEEILGRLAEEHQAQLEHDARLGQLDSGLVTIAERMTKTELLARETDALAQGELSSAADLRDKIAKELAALHTKFSDAQMGQWAIENLEAALSARLEEWRHQATQKFMLIESHDLEQEKVGRELEARLGAKLAELNQQQRAAHPPDEQMAEIERKLGGKIDELQKQMSVEREGLDHWGKGLREAFSAELSAMQARLSERQSEIEYRHSGLERFEEAVKASIGGLEAQLKEKLQPQDHDREQWAKLGSELGSLSARAEQSEQALNGLKADLETFRGARDQQPTGLPSAESLAHDIEESLRSKIREIDLKLTEKFTLIDSRDAESARQADETAAAMQSEIAGLRGEITALKSGVNERPAVPTDSAIRGLEESFGAKLQDLQQQVTQKFSELESRDAELKELKDRSQSLTQRVAQLSVTLQPSQNSAPVAVQSTAERTEISAAPAPEANAESKPSRAETRVSSEKEQLIKLQERMSAEIERVRAELKERSGRWKVRKAAS